MMDRPGQDPSVLRDDLCVLQSINRWMGGYTIPLCYLQQFATGPLTLLDLATGAADVPRAIALWAKRNSLAIRITAVDGNPDILRIARERSADFPEIQIEQQNLLALPYPRGSFDIVTCSLTLHHFADADVLAILPRI